MSKLSHSNPSLPDCLNPFDEVLEASRAFAVSAHRQGPTSDAYWSALERLDRAIEAADARHD